LTQECNKGEIAGFRLLATILAGVALGAAASALPSMMSTSATGDLLVAVWLLWTTSVGIVVLVYLSVLTGSKVIPNEIDLPHTVALVASFLAQCGLFASLTRANTRELVRWWFISYSFFGVASTIVVLLGLWILPRSLRTMSVTPLAFYRKGQWGDVVLVSLSSGFSMIYLWLVPSPSDRSVLVVAIILLTGIVATCVKQAMERRRLRRDGLI
jgi:hypothetical protein